MRTGLLTALSLYAISLAASRKHIREYRVLVSVGGEEEEGERKGVVKENFTNCTFLALLSVRNRSNREKGGRAIESETTVGERGTNISSTAGGKPDREGERHDGITYYQLSTSDDFISLSLSLVFVLFCSLWSLVAIVVVVVLADGSSLVPLCCWVARARKSGPGCCVLFFFMVYRSSRISRS